MAPSVEKKIAELEMGLLHLQQNIDIPEITLSINPVVAAQIKKCHEQGVRARVEDFGDKVLSTLIVICFGFGFAGGG